MLTLLDWLLSPETPIWLKIGAAVILVGGLVFWLVKPPHWGDLDTPDKTITKRQARPPF